MTIRHSELAHRVSAALQDDPRTEDAAIDVIDESGVITLTGTPTSDDVYQAAEEITRQLEGVIEVVNELQVAAKEGDIPVISPPAHEIHGAVVGT